MTSVTTARPITRPVTGPITRTVRPVGKSMRRPITRTIVIIRIIAPVGVEERVIAKIAIITSISECSVSKSESQTELVTMIPVPCMV